ncbi:MAG: helix-turn-helix domain-containing protein [Bacteroidota bacterium]
MNLSEAGILLKERRHGLGITQQELSDMAGVALRTVKLTELGKGNPSFETLDKLTQILGLEIQLSIRSLNNG